RRRHRHRAAHDHRAAIDGRGGAMSGPVRDARRPSRPRGPRRAFSLVEVLADVVVLSVALPPSLGVIMDATVARRDSALATRAAFLATGVLEHILADVNSADASLGFSALSNSAAYLDTAATGLRARVQPMADQAAQYGVQYTVTIGALSNHAGV